MLKSKAVAELPGSWHLQQANCRDGRQKGRQNRCLRQKTHFSAVAELHGVSGALQTGCCVGREAEREGDAGAQVKRRGQASGVCDMLASFRDRREEHLRKKVKLRLKGEHKSLL